MAVKIRLRRLGRSHRAYFQIVAADSRCPRDGRYLERIGTYDPHKQFGGVQINHDLALKWLGNGAQPTDTVRSFLSKEGILLKHHLRIKGRSAEEVERIYQDWYRQKQVRLETKKQDFDKKKQTHMAELAANETKMREQKAAAIQSKLMANAKPALESAESAPAAEE